MKNSFQSVHGTGITLLLAAWFALSSVLSYGQDTRINGNGYEVKVHKKDLPGDRAAKSPAQSGREHKMKLLSEQFAKESLNTEVVKGETVLVADLSPVNNSGPGIYQNLVNLGYPAQYVTNLPAWLADYGAIFVCLGMFPENYILSDIEGIMLVNYLNGGGNLFMEGGDTWYWDFPTPVHSMFNILGIGEAFWYTIHDLEGQPGTITQDLVYAYNNGAYAWGPDFDEIGAVAPALDIFFHSDPVFGCGVSYDAGGYRTVGLSFEIGGMVELTNTRQELVSRIMEFFGQGGSTSLVEDFETGDFSKFPWQYTGASPWVIDPNVHYEGNFGARSGQIYPSETSGLKIWQENLLAGDISFFVKVSCEPYYDFLAFYLDNNLVEKWDGEVGWMQVSFPVTPGNHLYEWRYSKDNSVSFGQDCAWVDYIVFPGNAGNLIADFSADPTLVCEGELVQFTDQSSGSIIMREWSFPGGIPSLSYEQNPVVQYNTLGSYDVSLTVSNGITTETRTKPGYITVEECTGADIVVVDLDLNTNSGPAIVEAIENLGLEVDYKLTIPGNLDQYSTLFLCLGTWYQNHVLTYYEGMILEDFLLSGKNLYLEGEDAWYSDPPTPVRGHFGIVGVGDGTFTPELFSIRGLDGTFTEGMEFAYAGDDNYADRIIPDAAANLILQNFGPDTFGVAVAHATNNFKTIGASIEFGGLTSGPSSSESLMAKMLEFFGINTGTTTGIEDFETGDFTKFDWQFAGDADWTIETIDPYEGIYCARSGQIGPNGSTILYIEVDVPAADYISFYKKVSSEIFYDKLKFYIDDVLVESWAGDVAWDFHEYPVLPGLHTFKWEYMKDYTVVMGSDCAWLDYIKLPIGQGPPPPPVSEDFETGDFSKFPWTFSGDQPWAIDNLNPHLGQFSARSGAIGDGQSSGLELTLNILSDGDLSFYRSVSSENYYDFLVFYIDEVQVDQWSGEMDWTSFTYPVTAGLHTFKWVYVKDVIVAMGSDCAWIDDITFPPYEVPCPPVVAGFDYTQSQTNPFTYYFVSTSQGDISAWAWDFGDGGTSTLEDPVHNFAAPGSYNVCLTVVNACNGDTDTYCEVVVVEDPCPPCVAAYTWIQDPGDPYTFWFNDASQGEIATWWWDFGDGTTSTEQFPSHTYALEGSYNVCLTITSACSYCMDTYCETITIDVPNLYNLGGTVFAGNYPIDEGFAYLFKIENGQITDVFASFIHEYGYYDFFQLEEGTYILKAELSPNSPLYNLYIPTYYVSVPNWVNADIINLQANTWNADVHMIPISNVSPGSGIIAGLVMKGEYEFFAESTPVDNVEILLSNDNGQSYICTYSDADGYFGFPDLAFGTYRVTAEVPGKYSKTAVVTIDENIPSVTDISFFIQGDQISLSIPVQEAEKGISIGEVYPNPAGEQASLDLDLGAAADILVSVFDQTGKMVTKEEFTFGAGPNRITLQTRQWSTGLFTVKILTNDGRHAVRKLIKP